MKKIIGHLVIAAMLVAAGASVMAQEVTLTPRPPQKAAEPERITQPDRAVVPLSNPAKPAKVEASVMRGSITVKGYEGKEVIAEARVREKALTQPEPFPYAYAYAGPGKKKLVVSPKGADELKAALDYTKMAIDIQQGVMANLAGTQPEKKERSHEGMRLITAAMTGLTVEEDNNTVTVNTESWKYAIDVTIQVPVSSSLELNTTNDGAIVVENVTGDIEITAMNGPLTLRNVSGNVVAHTMNGDIEATLARVTGDKPLSFSNMNGDIDVTLPADIKATVKLKSQMGNIYSDFDVSLKAAPQKVMDTGKTDKGQFRISFDKGIYGMINGGGQEISFNTFNGDIFLRKKK